VFLYVYYNAISRRDVGQKTKAYNEAVAKKLVKLELKSKDEVRRGLLFHIKRKWIHFIVGIEQKFLSMCNPSTVLAVVDSGDVQFFKNINQIEALLATKDSSESSTLFNFVFRSWKRFRKMLSIQDDIELNILSNGFSAPSEFIVELKFFRNVLSKSFSDSFLDTLLAILVFDHANEWKCSSSGSLFVSKLRARLCSFKSTCRAIASCDKELQKMMPQNSSSGLLQSLQTLLHTSDARIFDMLSSLSEADLHRMLLLCEFQRVQVGDLNAEPVQRLVDLTLQSLDIEGGFRANHNGKRQTPCVREPIDEMTVSRPKVVASLIQRIGNEDVEESIDNRTITVPSFTCVQQTCTGSSEINEASLQGYHEVTFSSGDRYAGHFYHGLRSGAGKYWWKCGSIYEGSWYDDERHGFGILDHQNGSKYEGEWLLGQRSGWGKMRFVDGSAFQGQWWNDNFSGKGAYTSIDGRCLQGEWIDGKLLDEHDVDVSHASRSRPEIISVDCHSNSDMQPATLENEDSTKILTCSSSFVDLLFGQGLDHHTLVSRSTMLPIDSTKNANHEENSLLFSDIPRLDVDVGGEMVSQLADAHQSSMNEVSEVASRERVQNHSVGALSSEIVVLESHNQVMRTQLKPLQKDALDFLIDRDACSDFEVETCSRFDLPNQETMILELTEQIRMMSTQNDEIVTELSLEELKCSEVDESEETFVNLSHQVDALYSEISSIKLEMERAQKENVELKERCRMIQEQNKTIESAIKFRSDMSRKSITDNSN
jgi:hypothetical protein